MTRTTPELASLPNFHTTPTEGRLSLNRFIVHRPPLHGGTPAVLGSNSWHACYESITLTLGYHSHAPRGASLSSETSLRLKQDSSQNTKSCQSARNHDNRQRRYSRRCYRVKGGRLKGHCERNPATVKRHEMESGTVDGMEQLHDVGVCPANGAMNGGHGQQNETKLCLWTNPASACNMTMVEFEFGDTVAVLEAKREEFVEDALIYAKSLCEELEISFEPSRRIRRKHIFGILGSKDIQLSYEDDLRRTMFSSIDRVTAEIRDRFQQL
ncbi:uncharacterized protein TNCV_1804211 [Trichonephila clavipes]|nr:uncharacterized protein TNCV_1804211 [Trichonephila clavipes]